MRYCQPLRQVLLLKRAYWDHDRTHPVVRAAFAKVVLCRTPKMGAEVYASESEEYTFYHPCKSRTCPSCGHRASLQWRRERWAALPDVAYKGITFTMPDVLWPLFRDNPHLAKALPALAAKVIAARVRAKYGVRVGVIAILHTFNGKLEFNSHVHAMVTAGGLGSRNTWISNVFHVRDRLMKAWQRAVIKLLRTALRFGHLRTNTNVEGVNALLEEEERLWWSIKIQSFKSKEHFLLYAGRYVRRPPIAQRRITDIGEQTITFWYKDKKLGRRVDVHCSLEEFIDRWAQHILQPYQHAVRSFGLFGPRCVGQTSAAICALLGQKQRPRPKPRRWAESLKRDFGYDPLLDRKGKRMKWVRRIPPKVS